jgi:hypothetical protein
MTRTVKYIRQDATGRDGALDGSSTFTIDAPKYIFASFMPIWMVPNKRTTSSKATQHAETLDQVSDHTSYPYDSDESTNNHYYGDRKRDPVTQREEERRIPMKGNLVPEDFSELNRSDRQSDSRFGASSDSVRALNHDFDEDTSVGSAFLDLLKAIRRMAGKLLLLKPRESSWERPIVILQGPEGRGGGGIGLTAPGGREAARLRGGGGIELTAPQEKEARRRARRHWICVSLFEKGVVFIDFANKNKHDCKTNGVTTVNLEENRLCRLCRHDHTGCEDCPGRGNYMYEELLEHFKDEIRDRS